MSEQKHSFPDVIYAVGGAGKEIVLNMLKNDWIIREMVKPSVDSITYSIIIIDTAIDEKDSDLSLIATIRDNISRIREEYLLIHESNSSLVPSNISIEYKLLTEFMRLRQPIDLIGDGVSEQIVESNPHAKIWWLNDKSLPNWSNVVMKMENLRSLDFAKGVYRKRAIGKAIFYKALADGHITFPQQAQREIDIICGFGGGSGSGMALDIAREIKSTSQASNISLFGVLTSAKESLEEKANCACMLSELEYIKMATINMPVEDENLFKNIILFPINAPDYKGELNRDPNGEKLLTQFDDAFCYALIAYHNGGGQGIGVSPNYTPFKIAVPQLIRYNVGKISKIQDDLSNAVENKNKSLKNEGKIYDLINDYISSNFSNDSDSKLLTQEDQLFVYNTRYLKYKEILESKYFEILNYSDLLELKKRTSGAYGAIKENENDFDPVNKIENILEYLIFETKNIPENNNNSKKDIDIPIFNALFDDLNMMDKLIKTFKNINTVKDDTIRLTLKEIIRVENPTLGTKVNTTSDVIKDKNIQKTNLEIESNKLVIESKKLDDKIGKLIEAEDKKWRTEISPDFENLKNIDDNIDNLINSFNDLQHNIAIYIDDVNSKTNKSDVDAISTPNKLLGLLDKFDIQMNNLNLDFDSKDDIHKFIIHIKDIKVALIRSNMTLGVLDKIVPGMSNRERAINDGKKSLIDYKAKLDLLELDDSNKISFVFNIDNITKNIDDDKSRLIDNMMEYPTNNFGDENKNELSTIKSKLDVVTINNLSLNEIIKSYENYDDQKDIFSTKMDEIKTADEILSKDLIKYNSLYKLIPNITNHYLTNLANIKKYHTFMNSNKLRKTCEQNDCGTTLNYVLELQPKDLFEIMSSNSSINDILKNPTEKDRLLNEIRDRFNNTIQHEYNGLVNNSLVSKNNRYKWTNAELALSIVTNVNKDLMDKHVFNHVNIRNMHDTFDVNDTIGFNRWIVESGDRWNVGIVAFIGGILTDNLINLVDPADGYYKAYNDIKNSADKLSFFHHSYLLEKGQFIERNKIYNLKTNDDLDLFLNKEPAEISKLISDNLLVSSLEDYVKGIKIMSNK